MTKLKRIMITEGHVEVDGDYISPCDFTLPNGISIRVFGVSDMVVVCTPLRVCIPFIAIMGTAVPTGAADHEITPPIPPEPWVMLAAYPFDWQGALPQRGDTFLGKEPDAITIPELAPIWWHALRIPGRLEVRR